MRELTDIARLAQFMRAVARAANGPLRVYFTGGATAVLFGWRHSTIDVDLLLSPDSDSVLRALPRLKEELHINVELAAPSNFIPELPGWEIRSRFVEQIGTVGFFHYDLYSQALAKIERGHAQDLLDVASMIREGLVERGELLRLFEAIENNFHRYPAIDPPSFRRAVEAIARGT